MKHGTEWEREGSISYFDGGKLLFASGVGVRIHGGGSRHYGAPAGIPAVFPAEYGPREVPPGVLFSPAAQPIRRLVVHDDVRRDRGTSIGISSIRWPTTSPGQSAPIAPETKPVRFYLNGEYYGPFVLTERFDERFFAAHWGYDDIQFSQEEMDELWDWVRHDPSAHHGERCRQHVNIENLTRWFVAVAFSATRDAYQGPGQFLDRHERKAAGSG